MSPQLPKKVACLLIKMLQKQCVVFLLLVFSEINKSDEDVGRYRWVAARGRCAVPCRTMLVLSGCERRADETQPNSFSGGVLESKVVAVSCRHGDQPGVGVGALIG